MQEQELKELLARIQNGTATDAEKAFMENWYLQYREKGGAEYSLDERIEDADAVWADLQPVVRRANQKSWRRIAAAASIIFVLGIGGYFYLKPPPKQAPVQLAVNDLDPGKNMATLTLANGKKIKLSAALNGELATEAGVSITKTADGQLVYEVKDQLAARPDQQNILATARGEQYQVNLPDGSKVWLNAASSLRYPVSFSGTERKVELTGEAYFEVVHNAKQPFRVVTQGQLVEDIGTHFNINSYSDEPATRTTLLEGAVSINKQTILHPGEQAALAASGKLSVKQVNADDAVAWRYNRFQFGHADIKAVMRQFARWYDVEVEFQGEMPESDFSGKISRNIKASEVFSVLNKYGFKFKIEGKKVIVSKI